MKRVRPSAFLIAALLLTSIAATAINQQAQATSSIRTLIELGLKADTTRPEEETAGQIEAPLPTLVHVGETHLVHGKISIINERGMKTGEGVPNVLVKLIDIFNKPQSPILLATGMTDRLGFFVIEWTVEGKKIFEELGEFELQEGIGAFDNINLTVMAVFEGDDTYLRSTSLGHNMELVPLRLTTSISTDKPLYAVGEVAWVTLTFMDVLGNPVDPDSLVVSFDSTQIPATKQEIGTYTFPTPTLSEAIHKVTIFAEKQDYVTEIRTGTITVSAVVDVPVSIQAALDQTTYGVGDTASLGGNVSPVFLDRPLLVHVTNPNGVVFNVGQVFVGEDGTFKYEFSLAGSNALPGKWSLVTTYLGKQLVKEFDVGEVRTKFAAIALGTPEMIDQLGDAAEEGAVGVPIGIQARITNAKDKVTGLVYIVKVTDSGGLTAMLSWIKVDNLRLGESMKPAIFWIPEEAGEFTIDIFVWDNLANPVPLSSPAKISTTIV